MLIYTKNISIESKNTPWYTSQGWTDIQITMGGGMTIQNSPYFYFKLFTIISKGSYSVWWSHYDIIWWYIYFSEDVSILALIILESFKVQFFKILVSELVAKGILKLRNTRSHT